MYSGTRSIAAELKLEAPVACIDGSHIVHCGSHRELVSMPISTDGALRLFEALGSHRPVAFAFSGDRVFHDEHGLPYLSYVGTWSEQMHQVDSVFELHEQHAENPIAALVALGSSEQIHGVKLTLEACMGVQCNAFEVHRAGFEGTWGMIVRAAGVDKGTAITWLAEHYGATPADVVVVGDWLNDIPMFQRAGRSFAMKQAPDQVKEFATDELEADAWTGGGIAEAAERAGLL
jgi:hydroxymethylpyrimidine pyrophosphatase-like HAD family hydrolase